VEDRTRSASLTASLQALAGQLFSSYRAFYRFVNELTDDTRLLHELPNPESSESQAQSIFSAVDVLRRAGFIDAHFFSLLASRFPRKKAIVISEADRWGCAPVPLLGSDTVKMVAPLNITRKSHRDFVIRLTLIVALAGLVATLVNTFFLGVATDSTPPPSGAVVAFKDILGDFTVQGPDKESLHESASSSDLAVDARLIQPANPDDQRGTACAQICDAVYFRGYSSTLGLDQAAKLLDLADCLEIHRDITLIIEAHAAYHEGRSQRGAEYAKTLTDKRAKEVGDILARSGVSRARLATLSLGDRDATESDQASMARQRRVAIYVTRR